MSHHDARYRFQVISPIVGCCCQTPLQLADPTQLQWVGVGVDFVFTRKEGRKKEKRRRRIITHTLLLAAGMTLHV